MSDFPYAALAKYPFAPVTDPASDNVVINTRFTETMEPVQTVAPGTQFRLHLNNAGRLDLYTVGTGEEVFRLRRQTGKDFDYDREDLGITARNLAIFGSEAVTGDDTPDIFGIGQDGALTLSRYNTETKSYDQKTCQPESASQNLSQFEGVKVSDTVYAFVRFDDGTVASNFLTMNDLKWASKSWAPLLKPEGEDNAKALKIAVCGNNQRQNGIYAISESRSVWFAESRSRFTRFKDLGFLTVRDISVVEDIDNLLNIVAVGHRADKPEESDTVWLKRQKKYPSEPGAIEWDDWKEISDNVNGKAVRTSLDSTGRVAIFVMEDDDDSRLFIIREMRESSKRTDWTQAFPLGNKVPDAVFAIAQDANDLAEAFMIGTASDAGDEDVQSIYRFWQDPDSTLWQSETLRVAQPDEAVRLPVHSVEIRIQDGQQQPLGLGDVYLSSASPATLRINGRSYPVGPLADEVKVQSDPNGLVLASFIANSLAAPTIMLRLPGMGPDEAISIEPNEELQDRLGALTEEEILEAKDTRGDPILPGDGEERKENAKALAQIHQKAMSLGRKEDGGPDKAPYVWNHEGSGLRYHHRARDGKPNRLDLSRVKEQHWKVVFTDSGGVRYADLNADEGAEYLARAAEMAPPADSEASLGVFGFDLGDIWQAIKSGVAAIWTGIKEIVVTTIIDPVKKIVTAVKMVFKLIWEGVEYLIDKTIEFVQQAFEFLESVWAKVKAFFKKLWEWLAFLFNLADIARSAEVVEHMVSVGLKFSVLAVKHVRDLVEEGLDTISDRVKEAMDKFAEDIAGKSLNQYAEEKQTPEGKKDAQKNTGHNPVANAYRNNYDRAKEKNAEALANAGAEDALDKLLDTLSELADNFQFGDGKQAFEEAVAYFEEIGKSPSDLINLAMAGLVKLFESLALTTIALARGIILTILDLISMLLDAARQAFEARFEIPILSPIYKFFTGKPLTFSIAAVTSLIIAVPFTIGYKAATGKAPFPDQAAVDAFKRDYTAESLARMAGFTTSGGKLKAAKRKAKLMVSKSTIKIMKWCSFGAFFFRIIVEPIQNLIVGATAATGQENFPQRLQYWDAIGGGIKKFVGACTWILRLLNSIFSAPWLTQENAGSPDCTAKGYGQIIWIMQIVLGPVFGAILWFASLAGARPAILNIWRLTIWGWVHFVMNIIAIAVGTFKKDDGSQNGYAIARAVITPLGAQCFWFLLLPKITIKTYGISVIAASIGAGVLMLADTVLMGIEAGTS